MELWTDDVCEAKVTTKLMIGHQVPDGSCSFQVKRRIVNAYGKTGQCANDEVCTTTHNDLVAKWAKTMTTGVEGIKSSTKTHPATDAAVSIFMKCSEVPLTACDAPRSRTNKCRMTRDDVMSPKISREG